MPSKYDLIRQFVTAVSLPRNRRPLTTNHNCELTSAKSECTFAKLLVNEGKTELPPSEYHSLVRTPSWDTRPTNQLHHPSSGQPPQVPLQRPRQSLQQRREAEFSLFLTRQSRRVTRESAVESATRVKTSREPRTSGTSGRRRLWDDGVPVGDLGDDAGGAFTAVARRGRERR
ncbi:hypothetical protein BV898_19640 [Hypsibius exemplaris]|uniref:Uncharacterized protein n=1 Tax=Hypsibius exemplaris TaxID=2072580 RepID=A0A9X6RPM5_HYPEX|nr:hypothetical protein BV898_19640 [Hypsibius exemplaris]